MKKKYFVATSFLLSTHLLHPRTTTIHLFIHGTTFVEQTVLLKTEHALNAMGIQTDLFSNIMDKERQKPRYQSRELLLDLGLQKIEPELLEEYHNGTRSYQDERIAAYPTIAALSRFLPSNTTHHFYTFGWSGTLLANARRAAGQALYESLLDLRNTHTNEPIALKLYAHSHGGAVALYLAHYEETFKQNISIDTLSLFGLPVQPETVEFAKHAMFSTVINFYSDGDAVQPLDWVTTNAWHSKRRLSDYLDLSTYDSAISKKKVRDVRLLVNGKSKAIGHWSLWHYNKTKRTLPFLCNLPVITLAPCLLEMADAIQTVTSDIDIISNKNHFTLLNHHGNNTIKRTYYCASLQNY